MVGALLCVGACVTGAVDGALLKVGSGVLGLTVGETSSRVKLLRENKVDEQHNW